ncbi:MAG: transglycosylase domain-containing protein [Ornithinimicrobium sp.]|uniref:transglycosylase domain-containing protein n=1 Tax=Ornithinimicrobium sp. TaxID=1977084 RepID=UPI003D9B043C
MSRSPDSPPAPDSSKGTGRPRRGRWRARPRWQRILLALLGLILAGLLLGMGGLAVAYANTDVPGPNEFAESQSSILYYADGQTELARFTGGTDRESVPLGEVPEHVRDAMLSAEDRSFYDNEGVSVTGTIRAAWRNLTSDSTQGGSTSTQQYFKNYYPTSEQSYRRKAQEVLIAVKIDSEMSKDEILENYLNTIYYGRGAYGIQTASQAYFAKDVGEVSVAEGAFLAAVTNAPALYDPAAEEGNQERAQERFDYVVNGMVEQGWLSEGEAETATFPEIDPPQPSTATRGTQGYIAQTVRDELVRELDIAEEDIDRGGLRITSTIVQQHQDAAEQAVTQMSPDTPDAAELKVGLVAVQPGDGAITAMYGGADYQEEQLNITTDAELQAGSLFKVFALIAALQGDVSTQATFAGPSPMEFDIEGQSEPYEVNNFDDEQYGEITLATAVANSVNTVFVQLNQQIGPENTRDVAVSLGLPEDTPGLSADLSNVLGTASPTMVQMTNAWAAVAAEGELAQPYIVVEVNSLNGVYSYTAEPETEQVFDPDITADVTDAMSRVVEEGTGQGAGDLGRPAAGKSGTSERNLSAWFDGFTPQLSAAVLMFQGDGTEPMQDIAGVDQITGGSFPVQIWGEFMRLALEGEEVIEFPERVGVNDDLVQTFEEPEPTTEEPTTTTSEPAPTTTTQTQTETVTETTTQPEPTTTEPAPTTTEPAPTTTQPTPSPTTNPGGGGGGGGSSPTTNPGNGGGSNGGSSPTTNPGNGGGGGSNGGSSPTTPAP